MHVHFICFVYGVVAMALPPVYLQPVHQEIQTEIQVTLKNDRLHSQTPDLNYLRHKKRIRHRGRKHRHHNRLFSAKRYFEKQMLVRNRTLALLGVGMEKHLPNAVDLLDINPQELPGKSPFQNWHSQKPNQTQDRPLFSKHSNESIQTVILKPTVLLESDNKKTDVSAVESDGVVQYQYNYEAFLHHENTGQTQVNLESVLKKLLNIFNNYSSKNDIETTPCEQWMGCWEQLKDAFMGLLPSCPCEYPSSIFYEDKVWDIGHARYFRWKDVSGERLDVYKPGAEYCIRSLLVQGTLTLAVQHCCYDRYRRLLTRGSGAANPNLISPDVSPQLHDKVDILPWRLCKGDFTLYNRVRPPNNTNNCTNNPDDDEFKKQVQLIKYY